MGVYEKTIQLRLKNVIKLLLLNGHHVSVDDKLAYFHLV